MHPVKKGYCIGICRWPGSIGMTLSSCPRAPTCPAGCQISRNTSDLLSGPGTPHCGRVKIPTWALREESERLEGSTSMTILCAFAFAAAPFVCPSFSWSLCMSTPVRMCERQPQPPVNSRLCKLLCMHVARAYLIPAWTYVVGHTTHG